MKTNQPMQPNSDLSETQLVDRALSHQRETVRLSDQAAVTRLHAGWTAAEKGEPFDPTQTMGWQEGYGLRMRHPPRRVN